MALSIYDTPEGTLQPPPTATKEQGGSVSYCNITFFCFFSSFFCMKPLNFKTFKHLLFSHIVSLSE